MSDSITTFFESWSVESADERLSKISGALAPGVQYVDPRTPETITGVDAVNEYIGMFSASAPGWDAKVVSSDTIAGMIRATVAFGGPMPDGSHKVQLGQYFVEMEGEQIVRMVGFTGNGEQA